MTQIRGPERNTKKYISIWAIIFMTGMTEWLVYASHSGVQSGFQWVATPLSRRVHFKLASRGWSSPETLLSAESNWQSHDHQPDALTTAPKRSENSLWFAVNNHHGQLSGLRAGPVVTHKKRINCKSCCVLMCSDVCARNIECSMLSPVAHRKGGRT